MRIISLVFGLGLVISMASACAGNSSACTSSGGTVVTKSACMSASDYANMCTIGAYGCAPTASKNIETCQCAAGKCWNGTTCQ